MTRVPRLPKIVTDASSYLVLPMPRQGMGTLRVDGHLLRVRRCPRCGLHTTIHECPVCATPTTTPSPESPGALPFSSIAQRAIRERSETSTSSDDAIRLSAAELEAMLDVQAVDDDDDEQLSDE